eukprot:superscaffoldBa00000143_g2070
MGYWGATVGRESGRWFYGEGIEKDKGSAPPSSSPLSLSLSGLANYLGLSSQLGPICTARHAGQAKASHRRGPANQSGLCKAQRWLRLSEAPHICFHNSPSACSLAWSTFIPNGPKD